MDKEDVICMHTHTMEVLFSHEKEGNPAICNNMDEPWDIIVRLSQRKTNIVLYHLYGSEKVKLTQRNRLEGWLSGAEWGGGGIGEMLLKDTNLKLERWVSSGDR